MQREGWQVGPGAGQPIGVVDRPHQAASACLARHGVLSSLVESSGVCFATDKRD